MGDPTSLQPKISETICNMEKLRSEIHKNEVQSEGLRHVKKGFYAGQTDHLLCYKEFNNRRLSQISLSLFQTWLSEVEGKQSSRGDRRPSTDNHQHTPQGRERQASSSHTETSLRGQLQLKDEMNFLSHEARLVKCTLNVSSYKKKCFLIFDLKSKFMVISFLIFLVLLFSYYIIMF